MTNTTATYLGIEKNLAHYQKTIAQEGSVKTATAYYNANIGKVTSAQDLVSNYRLLSYALQAYGLGDQVNNKALVTKVLEGGVSSPRALANTLENPAWKAFATAFNFNADGASAADSASAVATTTSDYVEQQLETQQGEADPGVQLALYFNRVAPTVTTSYGLLGNQNLLEVVQTIFGLASTSSASQIDAEAAAVSKLVPTSELQDPTKLQSLIERFTANYDANYGPDSQTGATLAVASGNARASTPAADTILSQIVSANDTTLENYGLGSSLGAVLLDSLQLGG